MHQTKTLAAIVLVVMIFSLVFVDATIKISIATTNEAKGIEYVEIREYEGQDLSSINDFYENSIIGPQYIDVESYRLAITGLVHNKLEHTYDEIITNNQHFLKVVTLYCVEGWNVTILWEGIRLRDLLEEAEVYSTASVVILYAYDGYSTSLPLDYIIDNNIMIATKMNNITLPPERGYPFQLVAESQMGYKWIKWITEIEVSDDEDFRGYWESRGFPNESGYLPQGNNVIPEFSSGIILPLFLIITIFALTIGKKGLKKV